MIRRIKLIYIFVFLISQNALSEVCNKYGAYKDFQAAKADGTVKNFIDNGKSLGDIRNQDSIGYCYAYTGADVLEDWLKQNKMMPKNESVSALALGLMDHDESWTAKHDEFLQSGYLQSKYNPIIKEKQKKITELNKRNQAINKRTQTLFEEHKKKNPLFKKLQEAKARFEEESKRRSDNNMTMSDDEFQSLVDDYRNADNSLLESMQNNPEYMKDSEDLLIEKYKIEAEVSTLETEIGELNSAMNISFELPEGGYVQQSITIAMSRLCFESEVKSSDRGIRNIYDQFQNVYTKLLFQPKNLKQALGALVESRSQTDDIQCKNFYLIKELFPNAPFESEQEYYDFLSKLNDSENLFSNIIKKSCSKKAMTKLPDILPLATTPQGKRGHNPKVLEGIFMSIDEALSENKIAGVSYRSTILDENEIDPDKKDYHASSITGSMNICGEKYYRLRNSYGKESCKHKQKKFLPAEKYKGLDFDLEDNYLKCKSDATIALSDKYKDCRTDKCNIDLANELNEAAKKCLRIHMKDRDELIKHPYFCDENGNWIISKKHLEKGIFGATVIAN